MKFTDMPPDTFETARLLLRPLTIMDVDAIFGSYAELWPEVGDGVMG